MQHSRKGWFNFLLGTITCLFLIGITSMPSFSHAEVAAQNTIKGAIGSAQPLRLSDSDSIAPQIMANLHEADAVMAQGSSTETRTISRYVAVLTKNNVVPTSPTTAAFGSAGAVLMGDRLIVRGDFSNLTSPLRDYATDPLDPPNPNITSGVHIHQGEPTANGPFQYALEITPGETELEGRFAGSYTLTSEQLQALTAGNLYVDLHTRRNRAGELRGIFQPY
jgi:hypothetical protein